MIGEMKRILFVRLLALALVFNLSCAMITHSGLEPTNRHSGTRTPGGFATGGIPSNIQMDRDAASLPSSQFSSIVLTTSLGLVSIGKSPSLASASATSRIAVSSITKRQHAFRI
jgi:hypothetical protein